MMRHRDGWPFDRPITKADAPDYHKIVHRPMDLGTIRSSINRMKYTCNQEVRLIKQYCKTSMGPFFLPWVTFGMVFDNCMVDHTDAEEYQCGLLLEKYFLKHGKKQGLLSGHEKYKKRPAVALKDSQH